MNIRLLKSPKVKTGLFLGILFAVLFITTFIPALYFYAGREASFYNLIVRSGLIAITPILFLPLIYWLSVSKPIFNSGSNILFHILLSLLFMPVFLIVFQLMIFYFLEGVFFFGMGYHQIESILVRQFFSIGSILFFTYWGLVVLLGLSKYYEELGNIKRKSNELESQLELASLSSLRAQIKPHFLFNTLSMVDQMISTDPDTAKKMVDKLEKLLKNTFDRSGPEQSSLKEEVDFIKKYLAIEAHRFHDRLQVVYSIAPETMNVQIPRYLLQPLVENSLVHGVAKTMKKCTIKIKSESRGDNVRIAVIDDGPGLRKRSQEKDKGIGLKNVRERIRLYYGESAKLNLLSLESGGIISEILIPEKDLKANVTS
ncbi:hypothetical protein Asal01_02651 [Fodinibius salicampi]